MNQLLHKTNIAIFSSGNGSNAEAIVKYFEGNNHIKVSLILSNKKDAQVLERAKKLGVSTIVFNRDEFYTTDKIVKALKEKEIEYIVLAGFLWLVPESLLKAYPDRIINIHPALLPKHGGKGMYGMKVHEAVITGKEKTSGITIHLLNEKYDDGKILFQAEVNVEESDTPESLAKKIQVLEHQHYPAEIEKWIEKN